VSDVAPVREGVRGLRQLEPDLEAKARHLEDALASAPDERLACGPATAMCIQVINRVANSPLGQAAQRAAQRYGQKAADAARRYGPKVVDAVSRLASRITGAKKSVTVQPGKWDFFFGRVKSSPHNLDRSLQNLKDLKTLGFDESAGGRDALIKLFQESQGLPEAARHVTEYGVTITRVARIGNIGSIDIKYFYPGGNMSAAPEVSTIIPKIF
jgi:peptidoglycan hydrolase-like protein with peptidoglycan-binding domain